MKNPSFQNELINESSPYLLQHAHNPVQWKPWNESTLTFAKKENKLLLISIGYSACHWCHVMEKECFEDEDVATVMNKGYVNIKIDREERPDVDQIYMNALQLMTGSGGWPLNIVALPDGRPVWGATYVPKENWIESLRQIETLYNTQPKKLLDYANKLAKGIKSMDLISFNKEDVDFSTLDVNLVVNQWENQLDKEMGGSKRAPKFMMPNNLSFLMRYAFQTKNKEIEDYVKTTLTKMAYGGIFDHIHGGFSRYSVDEKWHIPHFEKMLYDNAQLVSLYSNAYTLSKNELYKEVVYETLEFIKRELTDKNGGFYSAIDADSLNEEGSLEEGAYYVFTKKELQQLLGSDFTLFAAYYNVNPYGKWEEDTYVLIRNTSDVAIANEFQISEPELSQKKKIWKEKLREHRKSKPLPRLDSKILTSWNGLMLKGYTDAYRAFQEPEFLETALKNAAFIIETQLREDGKVFRNYTNGKSSIPAFLEDYASLIESFIALYEVTFDEKWVHYAKKIMDYTYVQFQDTATGMFFFTSNENEKLITRNIEYRDNVIPSSNSIIAKNLFWLGHFFADKKYLDTSKQMLKNILPEVTKYPSGYSNWLDLLLNFSHPFYEIVLVGNEYLQKRHMFFDNYIPNALFTGSAGNSNLPLLTSKFVNGSTVIYVCKNGNCQLPVTMVVDALNSLKN